MATTPIPILPYDEHIAKALELLNGLGPGGIDDLQWAMSVLLYRLSKILCADTAPAEPVADLLTQDLEISLGQYPDLKDREPSLRSAIGLLKGLLQYAGWYTIDRVAMRTRPNFTDSIAPQQNPTEPQTNKPYSSWARPLPFRPLFCALSAFSLAFPVRADAKKYEDVPGEDALVYETGEEKPKVRLDRQRSFATLLDACDYQVGYWKAHFKSELALDHGTQDPYMGQPSQRPKRIGRCYWRKPKGSISPDIAIVRQRNQPPNESNITHVVDMKFGGDDLSQDQAQNYVDVFGRQRLYVLYFPGDCQVSEPEEETQSEWVKVLLAVLALILTRGRSRGRIPTPATRPAPAF